MPRSYSDKEIAEALAVVKACGGSLVAASHQTGIPRKTLEHWAKSTVKRVTRASMAELGRRKERDLATKYERLAHDCLNEVSTKAKRKTADFRSLVWSAAVAVDKMRLLRDQGPPPTEAAKTAAEAIKQAAAALVELSKGTKKPLDLQAAEQRIKEIQLASSEIQ